MLDILSINMLNDKLKQLKLDFKRKSKNISNDKIKTLSYKELEEVIDAKIKYNKSISF